MSGFEDIREKINKMLDDELFKGSIAVICGAMAYPNRKALELACHHGMQHEIILAGEAKVSDEQSDIVLAGQKLMEAIESSNHAIQDLAFAFRSVADFDEMRKFNDLVIRHENSGQCYHPTHGSECKRLWVNPSAIHTQQAKVKKGHALTQYHRRHNMRRRKFKQFDFYQEGA